MTIAGIIFLLAVCSFWLYLIGAPTTQSYPIPAQPPAYPNAQEQHITNPNTSSRVCRGNESFEYHGRVTQFRTTDAPEVVGRFYHTALVEQGEYMGSRYSSIFVGSYGAIFEHEIDQGEPFQRPALGFGIRLRVDPGNRADQRSLVTITEFRYEVLLARACHL